MKYHITYVVVCAAMICLLAGTTTAQQPYGDHIHVSDGTAALYPSVGMDEAGDFIVVWQETDVDWYEHVWAQRFYTTGTPMGTAYQVNSLNNRVAPRVAMARDGRHVILWSYGSAAKTLVVKSFNSDGSAASPELVVSDKRSIGTQNWSPYDVAICDIGSFMVVWTTLESPDPTADGRDILGQRFNFDGTPNGGLMYINSTTTNDQEYPRVAMNNDCNKAFVAWSSYSGSSNHEVMARAYDGGSPVNLDFQVNQTTAGYQRHVAVDMNIDPDNSVVVAWESEVSGGWWGIFSRLYEVDGTAIENERRLDEWPFGSFVVQYEPAVAITQQRDILAAWETNVSKNGDDGYCIDGRAYYFDGTWSSQYQVNNTLPSTPTNTVMDGNARGDYVVGWQDGDGVWVRRFLEVGPIFGDGFETGNASNWSTPGGR